MELEGLKNVDEVVAYEGIMSKIMWWKLLFVVWFNFSKGLYTYDVHESCLIFITFHPLPIYVQNFSTDLTLDVKFQTNLPPPPPPPSPTNYETTTAPFMCTNEIKTKTKVSHVTFRLTIRSIARFSPETMQWYH